MKYADHDWSLAKRAMPPWPRPPSPALPTCIHIDVGEEIVDAPVLILSDEKREQDDGSHLFGFDMDGVMNLLLSHDPLSTHCIRQQRWLYQTCMGGARRHGPRWWPRRTTTTPGVAPPRT